MLYRWNSNSSFDFALFCEWCSSYYHQFQLLCVLYSKAPGKSSCEPIKVLPYSCHILSVTLSIPIYLSSFTFFWFTSHFLDMISFLSLHLPFSFHVTLSIPIYLSSLTFSFLHSFFYVLTFLSYYSLCSCGTNFTYRLCLVKIFKI